MSVLFFDTETTGKYDFRAAFEAGHQPNLVQIAVSLESGPGLVEAQMNFVISPNDWEISAEAEGVHGISTEKALLIGFERKTILAIFNQMCLRATVLSAFNLDFDALVMKSQYHREGKDHRMDLLTKVCAMRAATPILKLPKAWKGRKGDDYKWPSLSEAYMYFSGGGVLEGAHDALVDVKALSFCYWKMVAMGAIPGPIGS